MSDLEDFSDLLCYALLRHRLCLCEGLGAPEPMLVGVRRDRIGFVSPIVDHETGRFRDGMDAEESIHELASFAAVARMDRWAIVTPIMLPGGVVGRMGVEVTAYRHTGQTGSVWTVPLARDDDGIDQLVGAQRRLRRPTARQSSWFQNCVTQRRRDKELTFKSLRVFLERADEHYDYVIPWITE